MRLIFLIILIVKNRVFSQLDKDKLLYLIALFLKKTLFLLNAIIRSIKENYKLLLNTLNNRDPNWE